MGENENQTIDWARIDAIMQEMKKEFATKDTWMEKWSKDESLYPVVIMTSANIEGLILIRGIKKIAAEMEVPLDEMIALAKMLPPMEQVEETEEEDDEPEQEGEPAKEPKKKTLADIDKKLGTGNNPSYS